MCDEKELIKYECYVDGKPFVSHYGYEVNSNNEGQVMMRFPTELTSVIGFQLNLDNSKEWDRYAQDGDRNGAKEAYAVQVSIDGGSFRF